MSGEILKYSTFYVIDGDTLLLGKTKACPCVGGEWGIRKIKMGGCT